MRGKANKIKDVADRSIELASAINEMLKNESSEVKGGMISILFATLAIQCDLKDKQIDDALKKIGAVAKMLTEELADEI